MEKLSLEKFSDKQVELHSTVGGKTLPYKNYSLASSTILEEGHSCNINHDASCHHHVTDDATTTSNYISCGTSTCTAGECLM